MRKFYVFYRVSKYGGGYKYYSVAFTLNEDDKANKDTFNKKLSKLAGKASREVLSWSLI